MPVGRLTGPAAGSAAVAAWVCSMGLTTHEGIGVGTLWVDTRVLALMSSAIYKSKDTDRCSFQCSFKHVHNKQNI